MKILILNQDWFAEEFKAAGHEVYTCGVRGHLDIQLDAFMHVHKIFDKIGWKEEPDLIIIHDESSPWYLIGLEDVVSPIVFYAVDTHHHFECHKYMAGACNLTYFAQKDYLNLIDVSGIKSEWLPLWASRYVDQSSDKKFETSFIGSLDARLNPERVQFFDHLKKLIPIHIGHGQFWDIFPFSEIVINQTVKSDLNFRVFEALMCGCMLLTEASENGLSELFTNEQHLVTYTKGNVEEVVEKVNYYLNHKSEMREIAQAGRVETLLNHTAEARMQRILADYKRISTTRMMPCLGQVASMNWAARGLIKTNSVYGLKAIQHSIRLIQRGLNNSEPIPANFVWNILYSCIEHDRLFDRKLGEHLLLEVADRHPELHLPRIAKAWLELNRGQYEIANQSLAKLKLDPTPEVYKLVDKVVREIVFPEMYGI